LVCEGMMARHTKQLSPKEDKKVFPQRTTAHHLLATSTTHNHHHHPSTNTSPNPNPNPNPNCDVVSGQHGQGRGNPGMGGRNKNKQSAIRENMMGPSSSGSGGSGKGKGQPGRRDDVRRKWRFLNKLLWWLVTSTLCVLCWRLIARKIAEFFSFNRGIRLFYASCSFDQLSRGSVSCIF